MEIRPAFRRPTWLLLLVGLGVSACPNGKTVYKLNVEVRDQNHSPIAGADVNIDGRNIGVTSGFGQLSAKVSAHPNSQAQLVVSKNADATKYYGQYRSEINFKGTAQSILNKSIVLQSVIKLAGNDSAISEAAPELSPASEPVTGSVNAISTEEVSVEAPQEFFYFNGKKPIEKLENPGRLVTVQAFLGSQTLAGVNVEFSVGEETTTQPACVTNERGRCSFRVKSEADVSSPAELFVAARKPGFQTVQIIEPIKEHIALQFKRGTTIDFQVVSRAYGRESAVGDISFNINGVSVGKTNKYGWFSYLVNQVGLRQLNFSMESPRLLGPAQTFELSADQAHYVRHFVNLKQSVAPSVQLDLTAINATKTVVPLNVSQIIEEAVRSGTHLRLVSSNAQADFKMIATLIGLKVQYLNLELQNRQGHRVIGAMIEVDDDKQLIQNIKSSVAKLFDHVFLEGYVTSVDENTFSVNLATPDAKLADVNPKVKVYYQVNDAGVHHEPMAKLKGEFDIKDIWHDLLIVKMDNTSPRPEVGDLVTWQRSIQSQPTFDSVHVITDSQSKRLARVDLFIDHIYTATSSREGEVRIPLNKAKQATSWLLHKVGFEITKGAVERESKLPATLSLHSLQPALRVEAVPENFVVKVNGQVVGYTPVVIQAQVGVQPTNVELEHPDLGVFKKSFGQSELEGLNGATWRVYFRSKLRRKAQNLRQSGRFNEAIELLSTRKATASDFLYCQRDIAEIYLQDLNELKASLDVYADISKQLRLDANDDLLLIEALTQEGFIKNKLAEDNRIISAERVQYLREAIDNMDRVLARIDTIQDSPHLKSWLHRAHFLRALSYDQLSQSEFGQVAERVAQGFWANYLDRFKQSADPELEGYLVSARAHLARLNQRSNAGAVQ